MKRIAFIGAALLLWAGSLCAQEAPSHAHRFYVSLQGGPALNIYENAFTYRENGRAFELFTLQGAAALGYDINDVYGIRLQCAYGADAGAANVRQTSGGGFYPYSFKHANAFTDLVINLNGLAGRVSYFRPKLYAGLGGAHTFEFTDAGHPWQKITPANTVFGFRGGFITEYTFASGFGVYADLCGEAYTDMYNGLMPSKEDQTHYEGYAGFPLDLRGILSLGLVYHF